MVNRRVVNNVHTECMTFDSLSHCAATAVWSTSLTIDGF